MKPFLTFLFVLLGTFLHAADKPHAVIVVGTHHYSPQKTMPEFAAELERLGFQTTVVNPAWDPEKDQRGLPGLEALNEADLAIFFVRFLKLPDEQLRHITAYLEAGKPVVCLRTSTHGFNYPKDHPHHDLNNSFGRDAFGTPYQIHLTGGTDLAVAKGAESHPVLTGIGNQPWRSPGTLYLTKTEPGITPLIMGTGKSKPGVKTNGFGTHKLEAEMTDTVAWTWKNKWGGRAFTTSLGHVGDFAHPQSMRVMVNGSFWAAGQPVPSAQTKINTLTIKTPPKKRARKSAANKPAATTKTESLPEVKLKSDGVTLFYGNSFVERLQEEGTFEALMHAAHPGEKHQYRSFAYTGDEVGFRIRPEKFGDHLNYLTGQVPANRVVMCFGMNEAFAGEQGIAEFSKNLKTYLAVIKGRHPGSELILVSPTAVEDLKTGNFPKASERNGNVANYCETMKEIAAANGVRFVDLFQASRKLYAQSEAPLTSNGLHLNEAGNQAIAHLLATALSVRAPSVDQNAPGFQALKKLVSRKAYEVAMAYHPANGIHYYGTRARQFEYVTEIPHHLKLANRLDRAMWSQAPDLATAKPFPTLPVAKAEPPAKAPKRGLGKVKSSAEDVKEFELAEGFEVNLFASSEDHPELVNPLQINFDARGRLWVVCFESYPVPLPGKLSSDKILIFEDTDGDGKADKKTIFADNLKLPDGFVFYRDGIIASVARQLIWLRDTDGDDVADVREELLRGADDTDTHHGGFLARTPQGKVVYCEGLFHRGQFETPFGPLRTKDATALLLDPVSQKLTVERQTSHPNPWKISYNPWGESIQMFGGGQIIDCDYYNVSTPVGTSSSSSMGMPFRDDKGCSLTHISGSHFPKEWQQGILTTHLLAKNAVLYTPLKLEEGIYVKAGETRNLISSPNKVFRPTDLAFGLDGALYLADFYYPIIGHAQHSIRDVNRDYVNGRIWRVTKKGAPLSKAPKISGASLDELFALFSHPQIRVRELVREELERRPADQVLAKAKSLATGLPNEELGLELLWLFERMKDDSQVDLYRRLARSKSLPIQRAAVRSLRWWAPALREDALQLATAWTKSSDERIRISVISVASYLQNDDPSWRTLIDGMEAEPGSPLEKVVRLASLYNIPSLNPEFPLLKVSPDTRLSGWEPGRKGTGGTLWFESAEARDLVLGYRGNPYMNLNLNNSPLHRATGSQHTKNGQINLTLKKGINKIEFYSEIDGRARPGKYDLYLANLIGSKPEGVTFAKDEKTHQSWKKSFEDRYATVTQDRILIKTVPSQLSFNVPDFTVKAGKTYRFVFENPDHMLHNLVITRPGKAVAVGELADAMTSQPDAMARHYVPKSDQILFATPQIPHHGKFEESFTAPTKPGKYPVICTFPGHWRLMKSVMIVED